MKARAAAVVATIVLAARFGFAAEASSTGGEEDVYVEPALTAEQREHWAYRPIRRDVDGGIDDLVEARLQAVGIEGLAPPADRLTLLRRLHFTLIGLPPTPEEMAAFSIDRLDAILDELLARPQYGEHWAQHWLDVVRFAETDGFEHDKIRPEAWRYRDWVIAAFNRDLPYDEFVALQIAGDELRPGDDQARLATGLLVCGPDMPDINLEAERRHNVLNDLTSTVGSAFLGLTIGCAQCHDHKDDAISQADFYRLRAFFDRARIPEKNKSLPHVFSEVAAKEAAKEAATSVLRIRGDFRRGGPQLEPSFVRVLNPAADSPDMTTIVAGTGRRAALAAWLGSAEQPLVARVMVNRVWQQHFGRGLVATPNDFGVLGSPPSHPELLDWLAADFIESGWSLKHLHRRILASRTWQQASRLDPAGDGDDWQRRLELDPEGVLLSRRQPLRLSGEVIRDAMLQAGGTLNPKAGGPGFRPPLPAEVTVTLLKNQWPVTEDASEHHRRSVYLFARRNLRYPLFEIFDRPAANGSCGRRHLSTTAPQSLMLLNSEFSDARAADLAKRLREHADEVDGQAVLAFESVLNRPPTAAEIDSSRRFIEQESLEAFALALFNLNEFVFID